MRTDGSVDLITRFFAREKVAAMLLPDGWFGGRPMETHHRLTYVAARPKRLLVALDDQILLSFSGPSQVTEESSVLAAVAGTPALVIAGFSQLVVDYLEYGSDRPHLLSFRGGVVRFVAPPQAD